MKLLWSLLLAVSTSLSGCNIDKCESPPDASYAGFTVYLLNATGNESLFFRSNTYFRDSVRVIDEQGNLVPVSKYTQLREPISFSLFEALKTPPLGRPTTRQFLLYLSRTDQDTIRAEFELFQNDCKRPQFKFVSVFYNNKRVTGSPSPDFPDLIIRKP